MDRCDHCPTSPDLVCLTEASSHRRYCDWTLHPGAKRDHVLARSLTQEAHAADLATAEAATAAWIASGKAPEGIEPPTDPQGRPPAYPPGVALVIGCPSWESKCNCLDKPARCRRDGIPTTLERCLACVATYGIKERQPDSGPRQVDIGGKG